MKTSATIFDYKVLPEKYDYLAPDNSEIRLLSQTKYGGTAHCILPPGKTSVAVTIKLWKKSDMSFQAWEKCGKDQPLLKRLLALLPAQALPLLVKTTFNSGIPVPGSFAF